MSFDIQAVFNAMSDSDRRTRGDYHLTLGALITALRAAPKDAIVAFSGGMYPGSAHSYRGYYADLSFEPSGEKITVSEFLKEAESALNSEFEGYKGGDFRMGEDTPLWTAPYGCCGLAIIDISRSGEDLIVLQTKEIR